MPRGVLPPVRHVLTQELFDHGEIPVFDTRVHVNVRWSWDPIVGCTIPSLLHRHASQSVGPGFDEVTHLRLPRAHVLHKGHGHQVCDSGSRRPGREFEERQAPLDKGIVAPIPSGKDETRQVPEQHIWQHLALLISKVLLQCWADLRYGVNEYLGDRLVGQVAHSNIMTEGGT